MLVKETASKVLTNIARNISELLCLRSQVSFVRADVRQLLCARSVPGAEIWLAAGERARPLMLRNCSWLLSFTQYLLQRGSVGDIRFVERKDISPTNGRGKRGTGIMRSASPIPAWKENRGITLTSISSYHRGGQFYVVI